MWRNKNVTRGNIFIQKQTSWSAHSKESSVNNWFLELGHERVNWQLIGQPTDNMTNSLTTHQMTDQPIIYQSYQIIAYK